MNIMANSSKSNLFSFSVGCARTVSSLVTIFMAKASKSVDQSQASFVAVRANQIPLVIVFGEMAHRFQSTSEVFEFFEKKR